MTPRTELILAGASPDTGNLGVSALCFSVLGAVLEHAPDARALVLTDTRAGEPLPLDPQRPDAARRLEARHTRRLHSASSINAANLASRIRVVPHPLRARFRDAAAVLDISGGDSFSDIYGERRLQAVCAPKSLAIRERTPLYLLPQTYGPFKSAEARRLASTIVRSARMCWARDARSFEILRDLLGDRFDPRRHLVGVDVAFALPTLRTDHAAAVLGRARPGLVVGVNISGLLVNRPETQKAKYGFRADYLKVKAGLVERLANSGATVVLTPHVVTRPGHYESDNDACEAVRREVLAASPSLASRIVTAPSFADPREVKWLIAGFDWFCGTRMHSTIASLSSGVPTAAVSYSPKTLGVFETCAQGDHVADPVTLDTAGVIEAVWRSFERRDAARESLRRALPGVVSRAREQLRDVIHAALSRGETGVPPRAGSDATTGLGAPAA